MDTQTLELIGQHRLAGELLRAGLEVAFPARDRGVDLIAYADINQANGHFVARPIQLKAASRRSFGIWRKYERIHDLIFAFVWNLDGEGEPETYALTYAESLRIGTEMGWTDQASWKSRGAYDNTRPGARLRELLGRHLMDAEGWREKVLSASLRSAPRYDESVFKSREDRFLQPADGIVIVSQPKSLQSEPAGQIEDPGKKRRT